MLGIQASIARVTVFLVGAIVVVACSGGSPTPTGTSASEEPIQGSVGEGPPLFLSPDEAVDLARFMSWFCDEGVLDVRRADEALVSEMTGEEADDFLTAIGQTPLSREHYTRPDRLLLVVLRGELSCSLSPDGPPTDNSLAMVFPLGEGSMYFLGLGPPWDSTAPPNAVQMPVRDAPKLRNVSLARAGWPATAHRPDYVPDGLFLSQVNLNPAGTSVDGSGATFDSSGVSLIYRNGNGETALVLSSSGCRANPAVTGEASPLQVGPAQGWLYRSGPDTESLVWRQRERVFLLMTDLGTGVTRDQAVRVARSITVLPPCPQVAPTATPQAAPIN